MLDAIMKAWRRTYRQMFAPEPPPRLDGMWITARMALDGVSWGQALNERERMNMDRALRWRLGERVL